MMDIDLDYLHSEFGSRENFAHYMVWRVITFDLDSQSPSCEREFLDLANIMLDEINEFDIQYSVMILKVIISTFRLPIAKAENWKKYALKYSKRLMAESAREYNCHLVDYYRYRISELKRCIDNNVEFDFYLKMVV